MTSFDLDERRGTPPTPVIGLLLIGTFLILIEGLLELWILHGAAVYGVPVPTSFWAIPAGTIALAALLLLVDWWYAADPSSGFGWVFILLGAISFLLGAGFLVGGIMIIVAGALASFAGWVEGRSTPSGEVTGHGGPGPSLVAGPVESASSAASSKPDTARTMFPHGVAIYRHCPYCGELTDRERAVCSVCGKTTSGSSLP